MPSKLNVLFVCAGNSCRSQMAEGWARHLRGDLISPYSGGIIPSRLDPLAVAVMAEAGVDISHQDVNKVSEFSAHDLDYVVVVCDNSAEYCPTFSSGVKILTRGFDDPPSLARDIEDKKQKLAIYRRVRDEMKAFIEAMPESLNVAIPQAAEA